MSVLYVDSSALARVYFPDEPEHEDLERLIFSEERAAATSEIARVELASAVRAAVTARRVAAVEPILARVDADLAERIVTLDLRADVVLPEARRLVVDYRLRTLHAIHLAVAVLEAPRLASDGRVELVTRDERQAAAARTLGLTVR